MKHEDEASGARALVPQGASVRVKICGLTRAEEAVACARAGARAIGCVFYSGSPRYVDPAVAAEIRRELPPWIVCVGVFVNESFEDVMRVIGRAGFRAVQLHGSEPPELVERLHGEGLFVIKALFAGRAPGFSEARRYPAEAFLVECGRGPLPGGNGEAWNWNQAEELARRFPVILAGGLDPENAAGALRAAHPDAIDVSSGVESGMGRKDLGKVKQLIAAVSGAAARRTIFS